MVTPKDVRDLTYALSLLSDVQRDAINNAENVLNHGDQRRIVHELHRDRGIDACVKFLLRVKVRMPELQRTAVGRELYSRLKATDGIECPQAMGHEGAEGLPGIP